MGETELRVAAKAIDGFIARVGKLEAENAELKAEVERLKRVLIEIRDDLEVQGGDPIARIEKVLGQGEIDE